jgi:hypothetical protein
MKRTIKKLALVLTFVFVTLTSFTQEIKGFTFQINSYAVTEDNYEIIYTSNQLYNVSLVDGYAVHNIANGDGVVTESQFYKVSSHQTKISDSEIVITFTLKSGISGLEYTYSLHISEEYIVLIYENDSTIFVGDVTPIRTFNQ